MAVNFRCAKFILFPYIKPISPYPAPPSSLLKIPRVIRKQNIYSDLMNLDDQQLREFLLSYQTYKHRVFGYQNPTTVTNPFYSWVIKHDLSAWDVQRNIIDSNRSNDTQAVKPIWCQARMGQSRTLLPDGRFILIGGEYEDYYDLDFCIYNDVIVVNTDETIEIYSYPKAVFAPTDFHTATLIGTGNNAHIIIIGSLGYSNDRQYTHTPVYKLNLNTFKIEQVATRNNMGWIRGHQATLRDNQIIVKAGQILIDDTAPLLDNIDTWVLNLNTLIWKNVTHLDRKWQRFYIRRQDDNGLSLWEYKKLDELLQQQHNLQTDTADESQSKIDSIEDEVQKYSALIEEYTNQVPNIDIFHQLLIPPIDHEVISTFNDSDDLNGYDTTLLIGDVKVGYKTKDNSCIQVIIEGKLSVDKLELLQQNLRHKLSKIENMACEVIEI